MVNFLIFVENISMDGSGENQERYPCNFCGKVFFSYQALGGHQNSHKEKRDIAVMRAREAQSPMPTACTRVPNINNMHATPQMQPNLLPPTVRTHAPNRGIDQMPHHSNYNFRRLTCLLTRSSPVLFPSLYYTHPQNHLYQNAISYNGFKYPPINTFRPTFQYPIYMYLLPSAIQQVKTYVEPRIYYFFAAEIYRMTSTNSQVNIHSSISSNGGNEKGKENISIE
jgi:C2H2-type zinc finger